MIAVGAPCCQMIVSVLNCNQLHHTSPYSLPSTLFFLTSINYTTYVSFYRNQLHHTSPSLSSLYCFLCILINFIIHNFLSLLVLQSTTSYIASRRFTLFCHFYQLLKLCFISYIIYSYTLFCIKCINKH